MSDFSKNTFITPRAAVVPRDSLLCTNAHAVGVAVVAGTVVAAAAAGTVVVVAEAAAGTAVTVVAGTVVAVVAGTVVAAAAAGTVVAAAAAGTVVAVAAAAGTVVAAVATAGIVVVAAAAVGIVVAAAAVGIVVASAAAAGCWTAVLFLSSTRRRRRVGGRAARRGFESPGHLARELLEHRLPSRERVCDGGLRFAAGAPPFCCLELACLGCCSLRDFAVQRQPPRACTASSPGRA